VVLDIVLRNCSLEKVERDNSLISRTEVRAVKYPVGSLTFHDDAARHESSTAGSRRLKKATVLALGYDVMMC
jgi:hypothetical protein